VTLYSAIDVTVALFRALLKLTILHYIRTRHSLSDQSHFRVPRQMLMNMPNCSTLKLTSAEPIHAPLRIDRRRCGQRDNRIGLYSLSEEARYAKQLGRLKRRYHRIVLSLALYTIHPVSANSTSTNSSIAYIVIALKPKYYTLSYRRNLANI